jgi:hypothetical protein
MATVENAPASGSKTPTSLRELPSISLIDHTDLVDEPTSEAELSRAPSSLTHTLTHGSIRQTIARRKYQRSKWQEGKGSQSGIRYSAEPVDEEGEGNGKSAQPKPSSTKSIEENGSDTDTWGKGRVRRGGRKVKDVIRSKQRSSKAHTNDPESHIDILYENQRGFFLAGIPRFSSNSLLNFDPTAWIDSRYRPSAVNITNAQVPDPSWEWAWRCWYVDMSGDVDEEGWEYSFWFGKRCAWHGTHPWFHSFVRRRRWLRKRSKRKTFKPKEEAHALTSDYFTIHSKVRNTQEDAESIANSEKKAQYSVPTSSAWGAKSWGEQQADIPEINNISALLRGLKAAAIDREKIVLVRRFLEQGGEELHYMSENMEQIMKLLVFQNSRKQLLSILMHEFDAVEQHRDEHVERGEEEGDDEKRHIDNLLKAVEAADEQCKQLEYWSDVKGMAKDGEILRASDHTHGWDHTWQGVDSSGPEPLSGSPTDSLSDGKGLTKKRDKGKQPARGTDEIDASTGSNKTDVFYSPQKERTQAQAMQPNATPIRAEEVPTPSQESELSVDSFESAHSGLEDEDDDQATEKAHSEDEGDIEDTPPASVIPIEAVTKTLNGHTTEDKGTTSS